MATSSALQQEPSNTALASEPLYLHLSITDPDLAQALAESGDGRERQEFALTALRIGMLALQSARGTVDGSVVRHEGERLVATIEERFAAHRRVLDEQLGGTLRSYFDPSNGTFADRVQRLLRADGELATVIGGQVDTARRSFDELFEQHLGEQSDLRRLLSPEEGNAFIEAVRAQVAVALQRQSDVINAEFTLDRPESALSRLVRELQERHGVLEKTLGDKVSSVVGEFSLDDEASALSRLMRGVEQTQRQIGSQFSLDNPESGLARMTQAIERLERSQTDRAHALETRVTALLEKDSARREEARRSTVHGSEFEAQVGDALRAHCVSSEDVLEDVGATTGVIARSKVGDFVATLGVDSAAAGATIVVEAKASVSCTLKKTLEEADEARRNRSASVCLFVHAARTAPAGIPELNRMGNDIVVVWDEEDPVTDVRLKAAWLLARALAIRTSRRDEEDASLAEMDRAIEAIRKQLANFEEIETSAKTVVNGGERIATRAVRMRTALEGQLEVLQQHVGRLHAEAAGA